MNTIKFSIVTSIILLSAGLIGEKIVYGQNSAHLGLYEDQALICLKNTIEESKDFGKEICKVIDDLDLFGKDYRHKLNVEFGSNFDNDTFDIEELD